MIKMTAKIFEFPVLKKRLPDKGDQNGIDFLLSCFDEVMSKEIMERAQAMAIIYQKKYGFDVDPVLRLTVRKLNNSDNIVCLEAQLIQMDDSK